ncbi:hypothetical protein Tco_0324806 [Tanacetum coccineum]
MMQFLNYNSLVKPRSTYGEPGHITIQSDFFFNKDLEYLRYGRKIAYLQSISKMKAAFLSRCQLRETDEALDYRVKEFNQQTNPGMNARFWMKKDVVRSKEFMFAIQKRLKIRRIFRNLESFVGGRIREGDYRNSLPRSCQNRRDLPRDNPLVSVEVLRYDYKRSSYVRIRGNSAAEMEASTGNNQTIGSVRCLGSTEGVEE